MRAIRIDPHRRVIDEIVIKGDFDSMNDVIGCAGPCMVRLNRSELLWVDDDGLLKEANPIFRWDTYSNPLAGIGLIIGCDEAGDNRSATMALRHVVEWVIWTDLETTGKLKPDSEYTRDDGAHVYQIGSPILRQKVAS